MPQPSHNDASEGNPPEGESAPEPAELPITNSSDSAATASNEDNSAPSPDLSADTADELEDTIDDDPHADPEPPGRENDDDKSDDDGAAGAETSEEPSSETPSSEEPTAPVAPADTASFSQQLDEDGSPAAAIPPATAGPDAELTDEDEPAATPGPDAQLTDDDEAPASATDRPWYVRAWASVVQRIGAWSAAIIILALVAIVAALIIDRWAIRHARVQVEDAVVEAVDSVRGLEVELEQFPFLPDVLGGTINRVDVSATSIMIDGTALEDVSARATDIDVDDTPTIGTLSGSATVPLRVVQAAMDDHPIDPPLLDERTLDASVDGGRIVGETSLAQMSLQVWADVSPADDGRGIDVTIEEASLGVINIDLEDGNIPIIGGDLETEMHVPLDTMPQGMTITSTQVTNDGIVVEFGGDDVSLEPGPQSEPEEDEPGSSKGSFGSADDDDVVGKSDLF